MKYLSRYFINFLFLVGLIQPICSHSQGFNIELTQPAGAYASLSIENLGLDTLMILPFHYDSSINKVGYHSIRMLANGNLLSDKLYLDSVNSYWAGWSNSLNRTKNGDLVFAGYEVGPSKIFAMVTRLDQMGDTVWQKTYGDTSVSSYRPYQARMTSDGSIIAVGSHALLGQRSDGWLMKLDSNGNFLWEKIYSASIGTREGLYSVQETYDGGFLLGGQEQENPNNPNTRNYDPIIIKTDSAGNQQWRFRYDTPMDDPYNYCIQTFDSNFVCAGGYTYNIPPGLPLGRASLIKVDRNGTLLWRKEYGPIKNDNTFYMVKQLEDSSLIAVGNRFETSDKMVGVMVRAKANGDSIFVQDYEYDVNRPFNSNSLRDVVQLSDGGFIACGEIINKPVIPNHQNPWIIRTDSNGCVISNCLVGVDEVINEKAQIQVYPNPSTGLFQLNGLDETPLQLQLFDLQGRMLRQYEPKASQWALPEAKGIYLLRIQLASGEWVQEKVVRMGD